MHNTCPRQATLTLQPISCSDLRGASCLNFIERVSLPQVHQFHSSVSFSQPYTCTAPPLFLLTSASNHDLITCLYLTIWVVPLLQFLELFPTLLLLCSDHTVSPSPRLGQQVRLCLKQLLQERSLSYSGGRDFGSPVWMK